MVDNNDQPPHWEQQKFDFDLKCVRERLISQPYLVNTNTEITNLACQNYKQGNTNRLIILISQPNDLYYVFILKR